MPRRRRDLESSTWFHVLNRGADRQDIFSSNGDHALFEQLLADSFERHCVRLHAYALMTNHYHALVHVADGDLPAAMQRLGSRYAAAYNARHGRDGPLFTGRFTSVPVVSDAQLVQVGHYIHRNPLAITGPRQLPAYRWSSLGVYLGRRARPPWLSTDVLLPDGDRERFLGAVLADHAPGDSGGPDVRVTWDRFEATVCDVTGSGPDDLRRSVRGVRNDARLLAVTVAVARRMASLGELAERYGFADARAVRQAARRGRVLLSDPGPLSELAARVDAALGRAS